MPDKYDLVITDMSMPNMTGDQLAKRVMEIKPDIPVVICTGYSPVMSTDRAKAMGVKELLMKPFDKDDRAKSVRKAMENSRT